MEKIPTQEQIDEHIEKFISTFVAKHQRARWKSLLASKTKGWGRIDVHGFVPNTAQGLYYESTSRTGASIYVLLNSELDSEVVVFRMGHDKNPGPILTTLRQALDDYSVIFEGVISVLPGKAAIVINHDDETTLCLA